MCLHLLVPHDNLTHKGRDEADVADVSDESIQFNVSLIMLIMCTSGNCTDCFAAMPALSLTGGAAGTGVLGSKGPRVHHDQIMISHGPREYAGIISSISMT